VNRSLRLTAGTLVLALPLAAAAGCGAEKKKTIRQEFTAAQKSLGDSKAAAFTLSFNDSKGSFAKVLTSDGDAPEALVTALLKGSITYVADPTGDATLRSVQAEAANPTDLKASLSKVNVAFIVKDDKADLAEIRLVAGDLYAHVNLDEIKVLAKAGGVDDLDAMLDENIGQADPRLASALKDVRAGKWLKLPLAKYLDKLQEIAGSFAPGLTGGADTSKKYDFAGIGKKAYDAVKPYVKVTDANDSSKDRVLDVKVKARPALTALLGVLKAEKDLPFASLLGDVSASDITDNVRDGEATGTITLHESHLTSVAIDIESIRQLATDPGTDSFEGVKVVFGIDDSADAVAVPTEVSTVDLGAMIEEFLDSFSQQMTGAASMGYSFSG
jgi:hypothetical protein